MESNTLNKPGVNKHHGDCTIYMMLINSGRPEAGICTCGYGLSLVRRNDNWSQMYSAELSSLLNSKTHQRAQTQERAQIQVQTKGRCVWSLPGWVVRKPWLALPVFMLLVFVVWMLGRWSTT
jgi:hypothetical protein